MGCSHYINMAKRNLIDRNRKIIKEIPWRKRKYYSFAFIIAREVKWPKRF